MARALRITYPGAWYHVMNRGAARATIFLTNRDRTEFLSLLAETTERHRIEVHAYCLMGNHFHLLVRTLEANLSRALRHLAALYVQRFNRRHERDGPMFRGRFKATLIDADEYLLEVSRYIHLNPVAAGLVYRPEQYRWSSYRAYLRPECRPEWLTVGEVLGRFGPSGAARGYAAFVCARIGARALEFGAGGPVPPVLGNDVFRERIARMLPDPRPIEIPECGRVVRPPPIDRIVREIGTLFGMDPTQITDQPRRRGVGIARAVAMYLCRDLCGIPLLEIARAFRLSRPGSVATVASRARRRIDSEPELKRIVVRVRERIFATGSAAPELMVET